MVSLEGDRMRMLFRAPDFEGKVADMRVEVTRKTGDLYHWALAEKQDDGWSRDKLDEVPSPLVTRYRHVWNSIWLLGFGVMAYAASQPIAFPHKTHIQLGVSCIDCHSGADVRAAAGIPSVTKCMLCHAKLGREKPEVKKVIDYANKGVEIPWERVYSFSATAHVKFQHAPHARASISCATCHGDLTKATVAERTVTHNMGTCLTCHRQRKAPEDCAACHY